MTLSFSLSCEKNSFVKVPISNHLLYRQMVNFILNFWSIHSHKISKLVIYTHVAGAVGGHLKFKILIRKFSALGKKFIKLSQNIPKITSYLTISNSLSITIKKLEL